MATSKQKSDLENLANINDVNNSKIPETGSWRLKGGLAQMLKGGVIMDVVNAEEAKIAEASGAVAVMALERVPADIRKDGGVARMSDPKMIKEIVIDSTILDTRENLINLLFNTMSETTQKLSDPININAVKIDNVYQSS